MNSLQAFLAQIILFLNYVIIPLLIALAFLFFIWNAFRYFILESNSEEGRTKARRLALYGIGAFVFIVSLWGIVNLLVSAFDIDREQSVMPDYILKNSDPWDGLRNDPNVPNPRPRPDR